MEYDRGEVIELEELLEMILLAIKDEEEDEEDGEGKAKGNDKNNSKGKGNDKEKGNNKETSTFLEPSLTDYQGEEHSFRMLTYDGNIAPLFAAKGTKNDKGKRPDNEKGNNNDKNNDKGKDNGKDTNLGKSKDKGKPSEMGWENALKRGNGKKYGLYKKLGLIDGPFEHKTGQVENILAVLDHIVNGEVNLPPGEHEELFELVREVGQGYTVMGTTWEYNERNEIIGRENQIRIESYDYDHDDAGNMTTDGRSIYGWNAKDQLDKVTFPDGFGQTYEYDAKGRRTKKVQFNHQENSQWEVNYHYQGDTWQITHETDQDGNTLMEFTYDEQAKPLSITYKGETFWYVYNGQDDVVAMTDENGEIAARYEYDEWGLVTRMYNRHGERIREGIGWIGDLNTGNGTPGSRLGPTEDDDDIDYHPGNGKGKGLEKNKKNKGNKEDTEELDSPTTQETESTTESDSSSEEDTVTSDVYDAGTTEIGDEEVTEDITTELVKENPYRYRHYYWDRKTQFYYLQARYYNPRLARFISMDPWRGEVQSPLSLNRYTYALNNPVNYVDPEGLAPRWALNLISKTYNSTVAADWEASLMIFGANIINTGRHASLYVPFHEIAQINIAKKLYKLRGRHAELEKSLYTGEKEWFGLKKKYYEADIVLDNEVWEVKPIKGSDPKPQLELYKKLGDLRSGQQLGKISDITVFDNIKMEITFPNLGEARYSLYIKDNRGNRKTLTTVAAAIVLAQALAKLSPYGRRYSPAF